MTFPISDQPFVTPDTIIPEDESLFYPWIRDRIEEIADAVNDKDPNYFEIAISDIAMDIVNLPNFGAYTICVSGQTSTLPTLVVALAKSDATASGVVAVLTDQNGTGDWAGNSLTITSTATNFQIAHNNTGVTGNFNLRIVGTQS